VRRPALVVSAELAMKNYEVVVMVAIFVVVCWIVLSWLSKRPGGEY
jgi:hypothetical protein